MDRHRVGRSAALSVVQVVVAGGALLFFYRYLLDTIGVAAVGVWSVVLATTSMGRIADFGMSGGVSRFVARVNTEQLGSRAATYVETAMLSSAALTALLAVVALPLLKLALTNILTRDSISIAMALLPYALLSFWVVNLASVLQGGLDGVLRVDLRNLIMIGSSFLQVGLGILFVQRAGIMGLAYAQLGQALIILLVTWLVVRRFLPNLSVVPRKWDYPTFLELVGFGWKLQLTSITALLFEPVTKGLLARFGGLASTGYYEMATRMIQQIRALLINANQVLVPATADSEKTNPEQVRVLYRKSYQVVSFLIIPIIGVVMVSLPAISVLWIGHYETRFVAFAALLAIGWFVNALTGPSYFTAMGLGRMRWNLSGHLVIAALNLAAGYTLGRIYGGTGVVLGAVIALIAGSVIIVVKNHYDHGESLTELVPPGTVLLSLGSILGVASGVASYRVAQQDHNVVVSLIVGLTMWLAVAAWPTWRHPARRQLTASLTRLLPYSVANPTRSCKEASAHTE